MGLIRGWIPISFYIAPNCIDYNERQPEVHVAVLLRADKLTLRSLVQQLQKDTIHFRQTISGTGGTMEDVSCVISLAFAEKYSTKYRCGCFKQQAGADHQAATCPCQFDELPVSTQPYSTVHSS